MPNTMSMPTLSMPDVSVPDASKVVDELKSFAATAADAISSAAAVLPGVDDYRAASRRNTKLRWGLVALAVVVAATLMVKKKRKSPSSDN